MRGSRGVLLVAAREVKLVRRNRAARVGFVLLLLLAWLPPVLVSLRAGALGLGAFPEVTPLTLALTGAVLTLLALLAGADLLVGELEDGSLVPVLTLLSRSTCLWGKYLARAGLFTVAYLVAFGSVGVAVFVMRGGEGLPDFLAVGVVGWLLAVACLGLGAALGATRRGRVRAYGAALAVWLLLVFVLDAILLTAVVATAPPPPESVGTHGHAELHVHTRSPGDDPHARYAEPTPEPRVAPSAWLMLLNPVDLFRLSALAGGPGLRQRLQLALPAADPTGLRLPLAAAWLAWVLVPLAVASWRLRRVTLT